MTVKAVRCQIQRAIFVPFNGHIAGCKRGVLYQAIRLHPIENFSLLAPKCVGVGNRLLVFRVVLLRVYQATIRNICGNSVFMYLAHGFCSPFRMLIICLINVKCRGIWSFVWDLSGRSRNKRIVQISGKLIFEEN
ncbi:hypothetical protein D3C73_1268050 [compost metagenome]